LIDAVAVTGDRSVRVAASRQREVDTWRHRGCHWRRQQRL